MSTAPIESKARRPKKKFPCSELAIQIHDGFMFFMKRLEANISEMTQLVINREKIITQLRALKFEVAGKLSQYTSLDENKMRDEYEKCDKKSLEILPKVMADFRTFFIPFKATIVAMENASSLLPSVEQIQDFLTTSFSFLSSAEERLREITPLNYENYEIKENPTQPGLYFNPPLWGGRRSKGWRRKTIRGRNKKTKRRRNKSTRLH